MKKVLILISLCLIVFVGCSTVDTSCHRGSEDKEQIVDSQNDALSNNYVSGTNSDTILQEGVGGQPTKALDGIHHEMYYAVDMAFVEFFIGTDEYYDHYYPLFGNTMDNTYRGICEYYGITKDEYIKFWEEMREKYNESHLAERWSFEEIYPLETLYDAWFSDNYETESVFYANDNRLTSSEQINAETIKFSTKTQSYVPKERSFGFTYRYYTIDGKLIDYVGAEEFKKYIASTIDINIVSFIEYFEITREIYLEIYDGYSLYPYNPDYLFSADKSLTYFSVDTTAKVNKN